MKNQVILSFLFFVILSSCKESYDAKKILSSTNYETTLIRIAPYVIKKPDDISYEERFLKENQARYKNFIDKSEGILKYYHKTDTVTFFFFQHRDLSSLFEHYRGLGGYFKTQNDSITFLNILYHTPRLTKKQMENRGYKLFAEMITSGNVDHFMKDKKFIDTPNADFYYDTKTNRWDYTPNSSWKFLEEAKQLADSTQAN